MVGFDNGTESSRTLDGLPATAINADLTRAVDLTTAVRLAENRGLAFMGDTKGGAFDAPGNVAARMLAAPLNPNGRSNSDVLRPWVNGLDVTRRPRGMWIIDFGVDMAEHQAALYELPYEHVRRDVLPDRVHNNRQAYRDRWWLHMEPRPAMRRALAPLSRYIGTPTVAKHRIFVWFEHPTLPDHQVIVTARQDDYFFGVLHSKVRELWALRLGTWLGVGNDPRYTPTTTFETFPFPWPPGCEPADDAGIEAVAAAGGELVKLRDAWLNPPGASAADLTGRTLTKLYNQRPTWPSVAHDRLDCAVLEAYGWSHDLTDDQILECLLALNLARPAA
jgi:hypothetical protein